MSDQTTIEILSALEHEQWVVWAITLMEREQLSPERVARWNTLMVPYEQLSEEVKEFDRVWARKVYAIMESSLEQARRECAQLRDACDIHEALAKHAKERAEVAEKDRDHWKANHDNMAEIKRAVLDRPDLKERAGLVMKLIAEREEHKKWWQDEMARADRMTSRLASEDNLLAKFQLGPMAQQVVALSDEVMVLARAQTDGMYVLRLARRIWRDLRHAVDDLPKERQEEYRWRMQSFGKHLGHTEDYRTNLQSNIMEQIMEIDHLKQVIKEMNAEAVGQNWSTALWEKVTKIMESKS